MLPEKTSKMWNYFLLGPLVPFNFIAQGSRDTSKMTRHLDVEQVVADNEIGGGTRNQTRGSRLCGPLPYHLAMPPCREGFELGIVNTTILNRDRSANVFSLFSIHC